jgi:cytochrome c-type biogenesis protein CcmH
MTNRATISALAAALAMALALAVPPTFATDAAPTEKDPVAQARAVKLSETLRCLVCQNQTIADSNATLAQDLRREVREMIADGKTDAEIRTFMIERYGDFVLYRPRMTATNFLLWAAPVLLLLLGGFIGIRYIRRQAAESDADSPEAGQS